jgi:hypothetical protein
VGVRDAIASIHADRTLDDGQRRTAVYRFKVGLLLDVLANGAGPRARLIGRPYTHKGLVYLINQAWAGPNNELMMDFVVNGLVHQIVIVNPPLIPREPTGDERSDMMSAVVEMLEDLPTDDAP